MEAEGSNLTMCIIRNDMGSTQDGGQIDKTESKGIIIGDKPNMMKLTPLATTGSRYIVPVPAYPENIDLLDHQAC